jgi:L-threonylcarbamoyladenylate synthase
VPSPRIVRVDAAAPDVGALLPAAERLRRGGIVAFPTETVYGLGAHAFDGAAVERVFAAKGRPADNPLIVHLDDRDHLPRVAARVPPLAVALARRWWPGPLTVVVEARPDLPRVVTGGLDTVAVRVPDHPVALALLRAAGVPVAAPSANRSGRPSPTSAQHVLDDLGDAVDLVVDAGPCRVGLESTVVDARGAHPVVLREGAVTREDLAAVGAAEASAHSPGTRYRHYAPACRVEIAAAGAAVAAAEARAAEGARVGLVARRHAPAPVEMIATYDAPDDLARVLYDALRAAEHAGVDVLVVEAVAEDGLGRAVMDRLRRAAAS